ncbi:hypothetical protein [Methanocalculus sp. MSAO_Arc2]|uniref:hypothetical protein n=1 Tax=Methanocalculus sp. MSAO_Arc2 TaxID=2293855 RepID=UPI002695B48E
MMTNCLKAGNKPVFFLFLLVLISIMLIAPSAAKTLPERVYVNESYTEETQDYGYLNFSRIQDAIDGVATGGEVWVHEGTYYESLIIDKSVHVTTIASQEHPGSFRTIIDAGGEENGVLIFAGDVSISGFFIRNASTVGIYAHNADSISIMDNIIVLFTDSDEDTTGIMTEEGDGICIVRNLVINFGHFTRSGIVVAGISDGIIEENEVMVLSSGSAITGLYEDFSLVSAACPRDEDRALFSSDSVQNVWTRTDGICILQSNTVAVQENQVISISLIDDEEGGYSTFADAWGIRSCTSERVQILNNTAAVLAQSPHLTRSVGIYGSGNLALIEGNVVEVFAGGAYVQPVGIRLGYADKGRVLQNMINVEVDCTRTAGHYGLNRPAGIIAFDSYKAQIIENNIYYNLKSSGIPETSRVQVHGVYIEACDEARIRENLAIVKNRIIRDPGRTISPSPLQTPVGEENTDPLSVLGIISGLEVARSDKPEILDNIIHALGTVIAYQELSEDDSYAGIEEELIISGIHLRGGWNKPICNPVVYGNSVIVSAQSAALAGELPDEEELFSPHTMNPGMHERYMALVSRQIPDPVTLVEDLPPFIEADLDLSSLRTSGASVEMQDKEVSVAQVRVATAGIILEEVCDPVLSYNVVPVSQHLIVHAGRELDPYEGVLFEGAPPGVGVIDRLFMSDQIETAFLISLIDENVDEWRNLPEPDRAAIRNAILRGDRQILAQYAEDRALFVEDSEISEKIHEYITILQNEELFEHFSGAHISAAIPVSVSYGLLAYAEGDLKISGNEFSLITDAVSISHADGKDSMISDTIALSSGLISASGIWGTGDTITIADNSISIENNGQFMTASRAGESKPSDAAAASGHLIISMGIIADAEDEYILNNEIRIEQSNAAMVASLNRIKDRMALSAGGMAGLAVGILLDSDVILDGEIYNLVSIRDPDQIEDLIEENTILISNAILMYSIASEELPPPLDGSSTALSAAAGAAVSFGIVAPEAVISKNNITIESQQISTAGAVVEERYSDTIQSAGHMHPGAGAANIGIAISSGILAGSSYIANNDVHTNTGSIGVVLAVTEELLEDATALITIVAIDIGIVSFAPSYIHGNMLDGEFFAIMMASVYGDRVEIEDTMIFLYPGILSFGGDAAFNTINNGYIGLPYYDGWEIHEPSASHNWWGEPSGPSGIGPGTGSPVRGATLYEPWLTRPVDEVKETGKAYFGLEIGSPFIGGDGHRSGLTPGWNTLSFPLALEDNSWKSITESGDGLDYTIAYSWNPASQQWIQVTDDTRIHPLDAIYILMNSSDRLPVQICPEITGPPVRYLNRGWNLVGPAYNLVELDEPIDDKYLWWGEPYETSVITALASVEETADGKTGYSIVISPSINPDSWVFTRHEYEYVPGMGATRGYWVYMENPDQLAGFSTTPLPMPKRFWAL